MQHFACEGLKYLILNTVLIIRVDQYYITIYSYLFLVFHILKFPL